MYYVANSIERLDMSEFKSMTMYEFDIYSESRQNRIIDDINFSYKLSYMNSSYTALGVNNPKKFPSEPPRVLRENEKTKEELSLISLMHMTTIKNEEG